jgi:hypothetical protein
MRLDEIATEAAAHRAAVAALLQRHLPYGRLEHIAREVGKSREYLARILSDKPYGYGSGRLEPLRPALAAQLADALGFNASERDQLLEHAELSHTSQTQARNALQEALTHHELDVLLAALLTLHASANRASNPAVASHLYTSAYAMAKHLMESLPRHDYPLEFAQVCLVLNDLEAVLNRNVEGIYHARLATDWVVGSGMKASQLLGKDADDLWGNALVAEAVSFHNLGLDGKARVILSRSVFTERSNPWAGEAALNLLKYIAFAQRTSLRQVDKLADHFQETLVQVGSKTDPATTRLAFAEAKLRAYLACASTKAKLKKAEAELEQCLAETAPTASEENRVLYYISQTGALRAVIFLNTYGQLLQARGDAKHAEKMRAEAESRAKRAGLAHQLARMRRGSPRGDEPG